MSDACFFCIGTCFGCRRTFAFNPLTVPSYRYEGIREPVCKECMELANRNRIAGGLEPHPIDPTAYEACSEDEIEIYE